MTTQFQALETGSGNSTSSVNVVELDSTSSYTMAAWVKTGPANNHIDGMLYISSGVEGDEWQADFLGWRQNSNKFQINVNGQRLKPLADTSSIRDTWQHVTMVREGATTYLYLNGSDNGDHTTTSAVREGSFYIGQGRQNIGTAGSSEQKVYALKFWNRALTENEIKAEMRFVTPVRQRNLVGYWPNGVKDYSGRDNDLVLTGTRVEVEPPPLAWKRQRHQYVRIDTTPAGSNQSLVFGALPLKLY